MPDARATRRVTTGTDDRGHAIVVREEWLDGDPRARVLWGADAPPVLRADGVPPVREGWWPPPGGIRVSLCQRRPEADHEKAAESVQAWPDIHDDAGFHASSSIDVVVMLSGTVTLELDDGIIVTLNEGDSLVQNGTRHRWRNRSDTVATMAVIVVGAEGFR